MGTFGTTGFCADSYASCGSELVMTVAERDDIKGHIGDYCIEIDDHVFVEISDMGMKADGTYRNALILWPHPWGMWHGMAAAWHKLFLPQLPVDHPLMKAKGEDQGKIALYHLRSSSPGWNALVVQLYWWILGALGVYGRDHMLYAMHETMPWKELR